MSNFIYGAGDEQVTPNLGLATWGMGEVLAENMILLDSAIGAGFSVNGTAVPSVNFNNSTPLAPLGSTNITFQVSGSNVSAYVPSVGGAINSLNNGKFISNGILNENMVGNGPTGVSAAEMIQFRQFILSVPMSIGECSQFITTASVIAGATNSYAIYSSPGAGVSSLLIDSGPFDSTNNTGNVQTNSFSQVVLPVGVYYFAYVASDPALQVRGFPATGLPNLITKNGTVNTIVGDASNVRNGSHAMPASLGTLTQAGIQNVPIAVWQF